MGLPVLGMWLGGLPAYSPMGGCVTLHSNSLRISGIGEGMCYIECHSRELLQWIFAM